MLFLLLIISLLTIIYWKIHKSHKYWERRGVKYLKPTFLFGNTARSTFGKESVHQQLLRFYKAFPNERYTGAYQFTRPILIIRDPDLVKSVFVKDFEHFVDHQQFVTPDADLLWAKNLFNLQGSEWKEMRTTLSPAFTSSKMRNMFVLINETITTYMEYLSDNKVSRVEAKDICTRYTNDIIASVAFGIKCDSINDKNNEFYAMTKRVTAVGLRQLLMLAAFSIFPKLSNLLSLSITPRNSRKFLYDIIMETIRLREERGTSRPDMISLLMEEKKERGNKSGRDLSNDEIVAQAFAFLFAGYDTVSSSLIFAVYELARNPEIQTKLQQEIDSALLENGGLTYEGLMKMKYLDQVLSETLRLWPPAVGGDRVCTKPYTIEPTGPGEKKVDIKPGDLVWVSISGLQTDDKYFPNPDVFDPERFNEENRGNINPYTYMPFGIGPRSCIGMRLALLEVRAFLFHLLSKYTLVATSSEPAKINKAAFDLRLEGDLMVELKPRCQ